MTKSLPVFLLASLVAVAKTVTVFDIAQPGTYKNAQGGEGGIVEMVGEEGAKRLKVTLPVQEKKPVWPKVNFDTTRVCPDWRYATELVCEVYAEEESAVMSNLNGIDVYPPHHFKKGMNIVRYDLQDFSILPTYNLRNRSGMNIFKTSPTSPIVFYPVSCKINLRTPQEVIEWKLSSLRMLPGLDAAIAFGETLQRKADLTYDDCEQFEAMAKAAMRNAVENAMARNSRKSVLGVGFVDALSQIFREKDMQDWQELPTAAWDGVGARNERVATQFIVQSLSSLKDVQVTLTGDLKSDDGTILPASTFQCSPIGYIRCTPSRECDVNRDFPDAILSYTKSVDVPRGYQQPWWLETVIPADQKPGLYRGAIKVACGFGRGRSTSLELPISIRVRNLVLPRSPHIPLMISHFNGGSLPNFPAGKEERKARRRELETLMHEHRFTPDCIYRGEPISVEDAKFSLDHGASHFNIVYVGNEISDAKMQKITAAIQSYKDAGIYDKAYIYCFDEATPESYPMIKRELTKLRQTFPDLKIATTIGDIYCGKHSGLDSLIDLWVLGPTYVDARNGAAPPNAKIGLYVACGWMHPLPNHGFIEFPPFDSRMFMGLMMWKFKPDCYLYYAVDLWKYGQAKEMNDSPVEGAPVITNWTGYSYENCNGDGRMVYPAREGTLLTLRLKACALGLQDALYLQALHDAVARGGKPQSWMDAAKRELVIEDDLVSSLTKFNRHLAPHREKMARIAALLE